MEFRPCIDIHNGKVKQIVGGSLRDQGNYARENFISEKPAEYYADLYRRDGLRGGHVILLNSRDSEYYEKTRQEACSALAAFPQGMQVGGGIRDDNAEAFLDAGAYAVIVTSFVFSGGEILSRNLDRLVRNVGQDHIVLDLSCRARDGSFYIVTDRWQKFTDLELTPKLLMELSSSLVPMTGSMQMTGSGENTSFGNAKLDAMSDAITRYLPRMAESKIVLDSGVLVGELTDGINRQLGKAYA